MQCKKVCVSGAWSQATVPKNAKCERVARCMRNNTPRPCMHDIRREKDNRTRGHEVTLVKDQCRLDIRKYSFSQRTINEWNNLYTDCVTASSVDMFKNKVETYLRRVD